MVTDAVRSYQQVSFVVSTANFIFGGPLDGGSQDGGRERRTSHFERLPSHHVVTLDA